ncbi:MAG TPA: YdeI/OmpD-associated family protein [Longimicrobiales bacterium]
METHFFRTPAEFRAWLERHHATADELWVGFYKKTSGRPSLTWPESVDEALCFGWIDGIRKSIDEVSYRIRFTPRRPGSIWSTANIRRAQELIEAGRMQPAGLEAFAGRKEDRTRRYSFDQGVVELGEAYEAEFRANAKAWAFFEAQPPSYRRTATWWVISAKREETRRRRLATLIRDSEAGERIAPLRWSSGKQ